MIQLHPVLLCQQNTDQGNHSLQCKRTKRTEHYRRHQAIQYLKLIKN